MKKLISCFIILQFLQFGCNSEKKTEKSIPLCESDTSIIVIRHEECTECFDAILDSGNLQISKSFRDEVRKCYPDDYSFNHAHYSLKLTGEENIKYILFGDGDHKLLDKKYIVKGYVEGQEECAFIFRIIEFREFP